MTIRDIWTAPYALNHGIYDIIDGAPNASSLPQQSRLLPWEFGHVPELQRLLAVQSMDAWLDAALRPVISDQRRLSPSAFRASLLRAKHLLSTSTTGNPESDKVLKRGARLLDDQTALYDLLSHYWNALLQG